MFFPHHLIWIKKKSDKDALFKALLDDKLDVIATDHAPHTLEEKSNSYFKAPSGGPLVQHALHVMLEFFHQDKITLEKIVSKRANISNIDWVLSEVTIFETKNDLVLEKKFDSIIIKSIYDYEKITSLD